MHPPHFFFSFLSAHVELPCKVQSPPFLSDKTDDSDFQCFISSSYICSLHLWALLNHTVLKHFVISLRISAFNQ